MGSDPEFVVTTADPAEGHPESGAGAGEGVDSIDWSPPGADLGSTAGDDGGISRINVRMPDHLKLRVDQAAAREGLSVNSWLVRAAAAALERTGPTRPHEGRRGPQSSKRFTGWAR